jgi:hypothetical protein
MKRPLGITLIAVVFCLIGVYLCVHNVVPLASGISYLRSNPGTDTATDEGLGFWYITVVVPFFFGAICLLISWGLFRLYNWARFIAMLLIFAGAGAELPFLVMAALHYRRVFVWGILEFLCLLIVVWYLFKATTADKFLKPIRSV